MYFFLSFIDYLFLSKCSNDFMLVDMHLQLEHLSNDSEVDIINLAFVKAIFMDKSNAFGFRNFHALPCLFYLCNLVQGHIAS